MHDVGDGDEVGSAGEDLLKCRGSRGCGWHDGPDGPGRWTAAAHPGRNRRAYNRRVEPSTRFGDLTVATFVDRLASAQPVPGGGSAAAVAASLAAGLVAMVASLSQDRPKYAAHASLHAEAIEAGRRLVEQCLALADEDATAYAAFGAATKLPRETEHEREVRDAAIRQAARTASQAPFRTVQACAEIVGWAEALAGRSNRNASSDLEVSARLAVAAARSAAANVFVNLPSIGDEAAARELLVRTEELADEIERQADHTREAVRSGETRDPLEAGPA